MVVIRLSRGGANKRPFYKIVAADSRAARDSRYLEQLGYFNPIASGEEKRLELNRERVSYWLTTGAKPSERVSSLIKEFDRPEILEKRKVKNEIIKKRKQEKKVSVAVAEKSDSAQAEASN